MPVNKDKFLTPGDIYQYIETGELFVVSKVTIRNDSKPTYFHVSLKDGHSRWAHSCYEGALELCGYQKIIGAKVQVCL